MRWFEGFLLAVLLPALFAGVFGFAIIADIRKDWRSRHRWTETSSPSTFTVILDVLKLAVVSFWIILMLFVAYRELDFHYGLWVLQAKNIVEISVGEHRFTDQSSIAQIVTALKSSEWYSVKHGGWGDETGMVLKTTTGRVWQMKAGYYFAQQGAVVIRSSEPNGRGLELGQAFSPSLPGVLDRLGAPLSRCDTAHGHPCKALATSSH